MLDAAPDPLPVLTPPEVRVLGALVEKALSTPEYYPLTLGALVAACNQKSNREPVAEYADADVREALDALMRKRLAGEQSGMGSRVVKYRTLVGGVYDLAKGEKAVLAELMLRGPQTAGELRTRTARMHPFADLADVEATLRALADREPPLVAETAGRREPRWAHLFAGPPVAAPEGVATPTRPTTPSGALAEEVDALRARVAALEAAFAAFREQFE